MEPTRRNNPAAPRPIPLGLSGLTLWLLPLADFTPAELLERASLTAEERAVYATLSGDSRRCEWLGARLLAREQLGRQIIYTPEGRPQLSPPSATDISISHTTGWVALAASDAARCGIDIELRQRDATRAAQRIARPDELTAAARIYPSNPALWLWCAKEAAYKAAGRPATDFARDIRLETLAQTLIMTVETTPVTLAFFTRGELLGVAGRVSDR